MKLSGDVGIQAGKETVMGAVAIGKDDFQATVEKG